jgi:protein-disulfide isomerase
MLRCIRIDRFDGGRNTQQKRTSMNARMLAPRTLAMATILAATGCQGSGSFAKLQEQLAQIGDKQDQILARLDQLEEKLDKGVAGRPAAPDAAAQQRPGQPDPKATYKVTVNPDDAAMGPATAKVTVVEWSDFQCPYCSRVTPTLKQLKDEYKDDVRVVFKHNPLSFHNRAMAAAQAAEAAGKQGKFWEMHDKLFENQKALTDENFVEWAKELGLDVGKFQQDMKDPALEKKIQQQQQQGVTLGARGTPAFFINGRFLSGAQPLPAFKALVDEEMKKAEKLLASGTSPDKLYDKVIEKGKTKV